MADVGTLRDAFLDELRDTYDAEQQLTKALPKMVEAAHSPELRALFDAHLEETIQQIDRLDRVFATLDEKPRGKHCDGMAGIVDEGRSIMEQRFDDQTADARLIAAAQRVEHYEVATYSTLVAWARTMGHDEAAELLEETLDEEIAAEEGLSSLAEGGINQAAADGARARERDGAASRRVAR